MQNISSSGKSNVPLAGLQRAYYISAPIEEHYQRFLDNGFPAWDQLTTIDINAEYRHYQVPVYSASSDRVEAVVSYTHYLNHGVGRVDYLDRSDVVNYLPYVKSTLSTKNPADGLNERWLTREAAVFLLSMQDRLHTILEKFPLSTYCEEKEYRDLKLNTMRILLLFLVLSLCTCARAQTAFTRLDETFAQKVAEARGTFVVIDFYANWCGPCKVMDERVWSLDTVQALQNGFVNIRIDGSTSNAGMLKYGINAIPALIIMDANGKEYFRKIGYMQPEEVLELLNRFPAQEMQEVYAAQRTAKEEPDAFSAQLMLARLYQTTAREAKDNQEFLTMYERNK